jgi:DNA polymerase IV
VILHVDLDAFYASVEQLDDPSLRGRPVVVGGHERRGVVCAASYEARKFGVKSAMPMAVAMRLCPRAVVLPPRFPRYTELSRGFFAILRRHAPLVEGISLDEAFLDVSGTERLLGEPKVIARAIKDKVRGELGLIASVGVAPSKMAAKIASDLGKPDGLLTVDDVAAFLAPLPIGRLWGVGEVTEKLFRELGIQKIGDVARIGEEILRPRLGADGARRLLDLAAGRDDRAVEPDRTPVSIGAEDTFDEDLRDLELLGEHLLAQGDRAAARLRGEGFRARVVVVKVKYGDHALVSRRVTLPRATTDARVIGRIAGRLLADVPGIAQRGVRLTGVSLSGLEQGDAPRQLGFDEPDVARGEDLGKALDKITAKFGDGVIRRAVHVKGDGRGAR